MSSKFGGIPWEMAGNIIDSEKKILSGCGHTIPAMCPICGCKRQGAGHRVRAKQCSRELQNKYFNNGGK